MRGPSVERQLDLGFYSAGPDVPLTAGEIAVLLAYAAGGPDSSSDLPPWEWAVGRVTMLNARISVLKSAAAAAAAESAESAEPPGSVELELPEPLPLRRQSLRGIARWCAAADPAIKKADRAIRDMGMLRALRRLSARTPPLASEVLAAGEMLVLAPGESPGLLCNQIRRRLSALSVETAPERMEQALELAAFAVAARSPVAARTYADRFVSLVRTIDAENSRKRTAVMVAARYLPALTAVPLPFASADMVITQLTQVLAGNRRLNSVLHDAAERLRSRAEEIAERAHLAERLTRLLTARGFTVRADWEIRSPAVVLAASRGADRGHLLIGERIAFGAVPEMPRSSPGFRSAIRQLELPVTVHDHAAP